MKKRPLLVALPIIASLIITACNMRKTSSSSLDDSSFNNDSSYISVVSDSSIRAESSTVVSSSIIVYDTLNYLFKHISYIKDNQDKNKLIYSRNNYIDKIKDRELSMDDKEALAGLIGSLSSEEEYDLISEVLNALSYNFIVTPKEVDFVIEKLSDIISSGINSCLHEIDVNKV